MADIKEAKEGWSWTKLLTGPFDGRTWAKALIFGAVFLAEIFILSAIVSVVKAKFIKPPAPAHVVEERVDGPVGTINKTDSHNTTENKRDSWQLLGVHFF